MQTSTPVPSLLSTMSEFGSTGDGIVDWWVLLALFSIAFVVLAALRAVLDHFDFGD